jgi:hypothetical protein
MRFVGFGLGFERLFSDAEKEKRQHCWDLKPSESENYLKI